VLKIGGQECPCHHRSTDIYISTPKSRWVFEGIVSCCIDFTEDKPASNVRDQHIPDGGSFGFRNNASLSLTELYLSAIGSVVVLPECLYLLHRPGSRAQRERSSLRLGAQYRCFPPKTVASVCKSHLVVLFDQPNPRGHGNAHDHAQSFPHES
jgi:hypothetical protein